MEALMPANDQPVPFDFDGHTVRVLVIDGEPWFVAADVCPALGIANTSDAVGRLDEDERLGVGIPDPHGRIQATRVISEAGLYSLILRSRVEGAKRFKRWVTHEVLPQLRRTGSYAATTAAPNLRDPMTAVALLAQSLQVLQEEQERCRVLQAENAELAPKAETFDRVMASEDTLGFREACKVLERSHRVTEARVRSELFRAGFVQRIGRRMIPTYLGTTRGYVTTRLRDWSDDFGVPHTKPELRITSKGLAWLDQRFAQEAAA